MEILLAPDFGVARGELTFFMRPDQVMQFVAVEDIGRIVADVFADRSAYRGRTFEIAGNSVTGDDLATKLGLAADRAISYRRFLEEILRDDALLQKLTRAVDKGPLAGNADIDGLRKRHPGLLGFDAWLRGPGRTAPRTLFEDGDG